MAAPPDPLARGCPDGFVVIEKVWETILGQVESHEPIGGFQPQLIVRCLAQTLILITS